MRPTVIHDVSRRRCLKHLCHSVLMVLGVGAGLPAAQAQPKPPVRPGGYAELRWDDLVPKNWDPMKGLRDRGITNPASLDDADPKVMELMRALREAWDNAPTEAALEGRRIRLPGYVVPLEEDKAGLTEFLLVPYFGACIHSPPPPANQIVLVMPAKPAAFKAMDTVWVNGVLRTKRSDSPMGASGYRLEAALVERYQAPAR
jgi:hypothetical protein